MKKFYMTLVALLCGAAAMAQTNEVYVEDIKVNSGEKTTTEIAIGVRNDSPFQSFQFRFPKATGFKFPSLVSGLSLVEDRLNIEEAKKCAAFKTLKALKDGGDDLDEDVVAEVNEMADALTVDKLYNIGKDGAFYLNLKVDNCAPGYKELDADFNFMDEYKSFAFAGNEGALLKASVTVDGTVLEDGVYEITLNDCGVVAATEGCEDIASSTESTFKVTVGKGTGIFNINADDENAPVYNIAGQRVSKAQKGVFIQNGKKVAVK